MMVTLTIFGILVSGITKMSMNVYPWQPERAMPNVMQEEQQYVADLVAGKVKVPEKYIREARAENKHGHQR
jgi:hypothetical protein